MKTKNTIELDKSEYIIKGTHPTAADYEVFYKGKKLEDVSAIVRLGGRNGE